MDIFKLKRNHDYFYQIRGQLHVTQRQYCYFVFWTPKGYHWLGPNATTLDYLLNKI
jgi:hypothetical protein